MHFVKLHLAVPKFANDPHRSGMGEPTYVNLDIVTMFKKDGEKGTVIYFIEGDDSIHVGESAEEIMNLVDLANGVRPRGKFVG
jgi:hypothetical protein